MKEVNKTFLIRFLRNCKIRAVEENQEASTIENEGKRIMETDKNCNRT